MLPRNRGDWSADRVAAVALGVDRYRALAILVAVATGATVVLIAGDVFRFHSSNHDEGVYLQQAAMLLEGQLWLSPGSPALEEAFHPWFFVEGEHGLYPKYTPVPAAVFALGKLAGGYRLALGAVAAGNVGLAYAVVAAAFDRRTGVLAAITMAASPLFLVTSSAFLPYAPTMFFNLLFSFAAIRSQRRGHRGYAALAGAAIGVSFFARPYTAVLFAVPFVGHAFWRIGRSLPSRPTPVTCYGITAVVGGIFVVVTLAYNATMTGSPWLFPYEAFAPLDGLGFGRRRILGHEIVYTPRLALRANGAVLTAFVVDWFTAGRIGSAAAAVGALIVLLRIRRRGIDADAALSDGQLRLILLAIAASVVAGNLAFWGNHNILGGLDDPTDGLIRLFGPFYHFSLLIPSSAFAAHGVLVTLDRARSVAIGVASPRVGRAVVLALLVGSVSVVGPTAVTAVERPLERNAAYAEKYEVAYEPFLTRDVDDALVFIPTPYGEWQNHPFQWLRNDPGFDGPVAYALDRDPSGDFAVLDAYQNRSSYRFRYHGEWTPDPRRHVVPELERVRVREGSELRARTTVAVPDRIVGVSVSISNGDTIARYDYAGEPPPSVTVEWLLSSRGATVEGSNLTARGDGDDNFVPIDGADEIALWITITEPSGGTLTYRETVTVRRTDDGVEAIWPPSSTVCLLVTECGTEGTYVPDRPDTRPDGIAMNTTLVE